MHRAPPSEALPVSPPPRLQDLRRRVPCINSEHHQGDCQTQPGLDRIVPHGEGPFLLCTAPRLLVPVVGYCSIRSRCVPGRNTVLWLTVSSGACHWGLPLRSSPVHRSRCSPLHGSTAGRSIAGLRTHSPRGTGRKHGHCDEGCRGAQRERRAAER